MPCDRGAHGPEGVPVAVRAFSLLVRLDTLPRTLLAKRLDFGAEANRGEL
jgi:hypothetical protein